MSTCLTIPFSSLRTLSNRLSDGGCCIALGGWPKVRVGSWESALEFRAIELIIFSIPYNSNGEGFVRTTLCLLILVDQQLTFAIEHEPMTVSSGMVSPLNQLECVQCDAY